MLTCWVPAFDMSAQLFYVVPYFYSLAYLYALIKKLLFLDELENETDRENKK